MSEPLDPPEIARREFEVVRRGYDQNAVRGFLHQVSSVLQGALAAAEDVRTQLAEAERRLATVEHPDEATMLGLLGEETTRVLTSAREAATDIRTKAEQSAERIIAEATAEASQTKAAATAGADQVLNGARAEAEKILASANGELERRTKEAHEAAERITAEAARLAAADRAEGQRVLAAAGTEAAGVVEAAKEQGKEMLAEAQAVRERVLKDLSAKRRKARQQLEQLTAGRDRLLQAYEVVRSTVDAATSELSASVADARHAAAAAARRIATEPEATFEQLDREAGDLEGLPITVSRSGPSSAPPTPAPPAPEESPAAAAAAAEAHEPAPSDFDPMPLPEPVREPPSPAPFEQELELDPPAPVAATAGEPAPTVESDPVVEPVPDAPAPEPVAVEPEPVDVEPEPVDVEPEPVVVDAAPVEPESEAADAEPVEVPAEPEPAAAPKPVQPKAAAVFARLHEAVDPPSEPGSQDEADAAPAAEEQPDEDAGVVPGSEPFLARDEALAGVERDLGKRLKRTLADEQNEVLDQLRRGKPGGVDDLLPAADDHAARWAQAAVEALGQAAGAGATSVGGHAGTVADLADELARNLVLPLRERIERSFVASDGNLDDVADRVRALYREWKNQRLTEAVPHFAAAAYAGGLYDALAPDARVRWVADPAKGACPDCDDNVLAGALGRGEEFPTGDRCAPAHPGCRCLVLAISA